MKHALIALSFAALPLIGCAAENKPQTAEPSAAVTTVSDAKVKAVLLYADWCGSCKVLDPKLKSVKSANSFDGVEFVVLDYTQKDKQAFYQAAANAGVETAVRDALGENIKTGVLLLVDHDDKKVIGKVTKTLSEAEIVSEINTALASS